MKEARLRAGAGRAPSAAARLVRRRLGSASCRPLAPRAPGTREPASQPSGRRGWRPRAASPQPDHGPTPWRESPRRPSFDSGWGGSGLAAPWEESGVSNPWVPGMVGGRGGPGPPRNQFLPACAARWGGRRRVFVALCRSALTPPSPASSSRYVFSISLPRCDVG